jgi:hypothetical protein
VIAVIAVINDCIGWIVCALAICFVLIEHNSTNFNNATNNNRTEQEDEEDV